METAEDVIATLGLVPHPEGGHYLETFRGARATSGRGVFTAIYYLLRCGESAAWHRLKDAAEVWHYYAGAPLELSVSADGHRVSTFMLGAALSRGERPQALVPAGAWQSARSCCRPRVEPSGECRRSTADRDWTLAGCTVAPAFEFEAFELAPPGWKPG